MIMKPFNNLEISNMKRLRLRQWKLEDRKVFRKMGKDPEVMRYFPTLLSFKEADQLAQRASDLIDQQGWGFWAVELLETNEFIGFAGLHRQDPESGIPCTPFVEIGWRLARPYWRKGYGYEAAQQALKYAFEVLSCEQIYAFTALINQPSRRLMTKLGMQNLKKDFDHPKVDHPSLKRHCLYMIKEQEWSNIQSEDSL